MTFPLFPAGFSLFDPERKEACGQSPRHQVPCVHVARVHYIQSCADGEVYGSAPGDKTCISQIRR
ncbi:hypothetical protein I7I50_10625 [Histoplasma capsulatum G186AR]|uniref:Uncharacterized protein n=1 Tax=Ajellomyces capsulatus TaxID=5037 RepID=A0A8H7Z4J7_AJECA|nr:hypothetical protein I7I52_01863 [Histoplasma capsulatum]QSS69354.1 hypothetical protein I7I50_10625 [Histoplasma capsulatum G186AR]